MDKRLFRLRVYFMKKGRLANLSHLEVARALERAVRRADVPYAISQGFSPHMKIAFGSALSVGVGSTCECFDVQLTRYVSADKLCEALQAASAEDLMVTGCKYIEPDAPAASVAFPVSTYKAKLSCAPTNVVVPEIIAVIRKKKEKRLVVSEYLVEQPQLAEDELTFTLEAKPTGSLRPDVFLKEVLAQCPERPEVVSITRISQRESAMA